MLISVPISIPTFVTATKQTGSFSVRFDLIKQSPRNSNWSRTALNRRPRSTICPAHKSPSPYAKISNYSQRTDGQNGNRGRHRLYSTPQPCSTSASTTFVILLRHCSTKRATIHASVLFCLF